MYKFQNRTMLEYQHLPSRDHPQEMNLGQKIEAFMKKNCDKHRNVIVRDFFFFGFINSKLVKKLSRFKYEQNNCYKDFNL